MKKSIVIILIMYNICVFQVNSMIGEDQLDEVEINGVDQDLPEEEQKLPEDYESSKELSYTQQIDRLLNIFF